MDSTFDLVMFGRDDKFKSSYLVDAELQHCSQMKLKTKCQSSFFPLLFLF